MADDRLPRDPLRREAMALAASAGPRPFIHLRVHSAYSLLEGALPLSKVVGHAVKDSAPAIAVTDTNNLFGALEFAQKAVKEGVQPIIGCQLDFAFPDDARGGVARERAAARPGALSARADRRHRGRLPQSGAAGQPRLSRQPARRGRASAAGDPRRLRRGHDLPDRRAARADRRGAEGRPAGAGRGAAAGAARTCSATGSMSSSSGSPATTGRSRRRRSTWPTATICRWSPPTRRSS